jgi:hypothetical protein
LNTLPLFACTVYVRGWLQILLLVLAVALGQRRREWPKTRQWLQNFGRVS